MVKSINNPKTNPNYNNMYSYIRKGMQYAAFALGLGALGAIFSAKPAQAQEAPTASSQKNIASVVNQEPQYDSLIRVGKDLAQDVIKNFNIKNKAKVDSVVILGNTIQAYSKGKWIQSIVLSQEERDNLNIWEANQGSPLSLDLQGYNTIESNFFNEDGKRLAKDAGFYKVTVTFVKGWGENNQFRNPEKDEDGKEKVHTFYYAIHRKITPQKPNEMEVKLEEGQTKSIPLKDLDPEYDSTRYKYRIVAPEEKKKVEEGIHVDTLIKRILEEKDFKKDDVFANLTEPGKIVQVVGDKIVIKPDYNTASNMFPSRTIPGYILERKEKVGEGEYRVKNIGKIDLHVDNSKGVKKEQRGSIIISQKTTTSEEEEAQKREAAKTELLAAKKDRLYAYRAGKAVRGMFDDADNLIAKDLLGKVAQSFYNKDYASLFKDTTIARCILSKPGVSRYEAGEKLRIVVSEVYKLQGYDWVEHNTKEIGKIVSRLSPRERLMTRKERRKQRKQLKKERRGAEHISRLERKGQRKLRKTRKEEKKNGKVESVLDLIDEEAVDSTIMAEKAGEVSDTSDTSQVRDLTRKELRKQRKENDRNVFHDCADYRKAKFLVKETNGIVEFFGLEDNPRSEKLLQENDSLEVLLDERKPNGWAMAAYQQRTTSKLVEWKMYPVTTTLTAIGQLAFVAGIVNNSIAIPKISERKEKREGIQNDLERAKRDPDGIDTADGDFNDSLPHDDRYDDFDKDGQHLFKSVADNTIVVDNSHPMENTATISKANTMTFDISEKDETVTRSDNSSSNFIYVLEKHSGPRFGVELDLDEIIRKKEFGGKFILRF